ncbi:MAG: SPASM domain-containing protein [Ktedonobacterales bacterium]|nr:SPASM domain-containing protein [Ktedonobacterales bacterium]
MQPPITITRMPKSQSRRRPLPMVTEAVPLPRELYLESTNRCNELCDQCPRTHLGREAERDLSLAEVIRITDQLPVLERVVLHGLGEPMLNPELPQIVAHLRSRGAYVLFNSNATALSERMGRALIEAGLNELRVSLDGATPATYARVRGVTVKTLPKILANVRRFVDLKESLGADLPRLSFWFTAMRENLHELPMLPDLARQTGVREIYVQRFIYFGEGLATADQAIFRRAAEDEIDLIAQTETRCRELGLDFRATGATTPADYIAQTDEAARRPWSPCQRPRKLAYITALGNVFSCCFAPFHPGPASTRVLGNVFEQSFAEVWNGARYQSFRAAFDSNEPWDQCAGCGTQWSL